MKNRRDEEGRVKEKMHHRHRPGHSHSWGTPGCGAHGPCAQRHWGLGCCGISTPVVPRKLAPDTSSGWLLLTVCLSSFLKQTANAQSKPSEGVKTVGKVSLLTPTPTPCPVLTDQNFDQILTPKVWTQPTSPGHLLPWCTTLGAGLRCHLVPFGSNEMVS